MSKKNEGAMVYSTNPGWNNGDDASSVETPAASAQNLRVWLEKNHRGGKTVSVIKGFVGKEDDLNELGRMIKGKCGTGGSVKDGEIIIQGDHRDKILRILSDLGYPAKRAGA